MIPYTSRASFPLLSRFCMRQSLPGASPHIHKYHNSYQHPLVKTTHVEVPEGIQKDLEAPHVVVNEACRVSKGVSHSSLGSQVHYISKVIFVEKVKQ